VSLVVAFCYSQGGRKASTGHFPVFGIFFIPSLCEYEGESPLSPRRGGVSLGERHPVAYLGLISPHYNGLKLDVVQFLWWPEDNPGKRGLGVCWPPPPLAVSGKISRPCRHMYCHALPPRCTSAPLGSVVFLQDQAFFASPT